MRCDHSWLTGIALSALLAAGCRDGDKPAAHGEDDGHGHATRPADDASAALGPETSGVKVDMSKGWCAGHGVPESVCTRCDETLIPAFKAADDWCAGHNLPESQCVKCNPQVKARWAALKPQDAPAQDPHAPPSTGPASGTGPGNGRRLLAAPNDPLCEVSRTLIRFADATIAAKAGITVEPAAPRRMSSAVTAPAEVEYDARRLVRVTPRAGGIITEVRAELGAAVRAGEVLAVIESPELGEAKSRYIELYENLLLARADLERAAAVEESTQRLLAAAPAATTRPSAGDALVGEARGRLVAAQTALSLAQAAFDRAARLKADGAVSQEAFDSARAALAKAESDHAVARDTLAFEGRRNRLAAEKAVRTAQTALDVAARRLQLLGVEPDRITALPGGDPEALSRYELLSPIAGQVVEHRAVNGESAGERDPLFTLADLSTLWLDIDVPLRDAVLLARGQRVLFTADGLPGESFSGELTWISPQVDEQARTLTARAVLPNPRGRIRAKMYGTARIILHENADVLTVPEQAVQTDGCCQLVFVRRSEQTYAPRQVTLGSAAGGYVEVLEGLAAGEPVVTTGSFLMKTEILKSSIGAGCCEVDPGR
ncbi:MAG: hypothetical protein AMXMBFR83_22900 [Phycisphaerae bacterium]